MIQLVTILISISTIALGIHTIFNAVKIRENYLAKEGKMGSSKLYEKFMVFCYRLTGTFFILFGILMFICLVVIKK